MGDVEKELQLKVTTIGAQQAAREMENLADATGKVTTASARDLEQMGDAAKKVVGDGKFLGSVGEAAKQAASGTQEAAGAAATAVHQFGELKKSGEDVTKIYRGLQETSEGGTRGILGSLTALRGTVGVFRAIGSVLAGPVGVGLGAAAAGIAYLGRISRENQAAIEKVFAQAGKRSAELKASVENLEAASTKSFEKQLKDVEALDAAYTALLAKMDEAQGRAKSLGSARAELVKANLDRDEQRELGKAKTDEERAKIGAKFAGRRSSFELQRKSDALNEDDAFAQQRLGVAQAQLGARQQQRDIAAREAAEAKATADNAITAAGVVAKQKGVGSTAHEEALLAADEAAKAAKLATENLKKLNLELAKTGALVDQETATAAATLERNALARQALGAGTEAERLRQGNEAKPKIDALRAASATAMAEGNFTAQEKANAELRALEKSVGSGTAPFFTDPKTRPQSSRPASSPSIEIKTVEDQTRFIRKGSDELVAAHQRNADAMIDFQRRLKGAQEKTARQIANSRE